MDFGVEWKDLFAMLVSIICGGAIGFEREYRSKWAGFRTIILICLGSTIFTIISGHGADTDDRISANIITGIGFIGAGVIFQDKISVRGLTTAAVIWTAAAIGMTAGIGLHALAVSLTVITLFVLLMVSRVETLISKIRKQKLITITLKSSELALLERLEDKMSSAEVSFQRMEMTKEHGKLSLVYIITGRKHATERMNLMLLDMDEVLSFV